MNIISDEVLKKKYDQSYRKFVKGNFLEVIRECKKILKKRKHQLFFNLLSIAYQKNGEIEKSIDVMKEALALNPNHPNFLNYLEYEDDDCLFSNLFYNNFLLQNTCVAYKNMYLYYSKSLDDWDSKLTLLS